MKKYEIQIEGVSPMIQNRLSRDLLQEISRIPKKELEQWEDANWEKKLHIKNINGREEIVQPERSVKAMLLETCKKYKIPPPKTVGRTWTAYFNSCVFVEQPAIIDHSSLEPFGTMVNGNPSKGSGSSKVWRVRPMLNDWKTTITLVDVDDKTDVEQITELLELAGKLIGLSDWRPEYGRFKVVSVKEAN